MLFVFSIDAWKRRRKKEEETLEAIYRRKKYTTTFIDHVSRWSTPRKIYVEPELIIA